MPRKPFALASVSVKRRIAGKRKISEVVIKFTCIKMIVVVVVVVVMC